MVQRSPRPMIQIFDRNGQFIRRFGNDLESPRAICIDQQGRIIVIESKIMKGTARIPPAREKETIVGYLPSSYLRCHIRSHLGPMWSAGSFEFSNQCLCQRSTRTVRERQRIAFRTCLRLYGTTLEKYWCRNHLSNSLSHCKNFIGRSADLCASSVFVESTSTGIDCCR